jgi:putative glutamine amidotransferase
MVDTWIVGVTGYHVTGEEGYGGRLRGVNGQGFSVIGHDYLQSVEAVGGIPVGLPVTSSPHLARVVSTLDAVVIAGGEDIDPRRYNEYVDARFGRLCPERDEFELRLLDLALAQNKPVLAICRGMQLVNVYFGGTLYTDVADKAGFGMGDEPGGVSTTAGGVAGSVAGRTNQSTDVETRGPLTHNFENIPRWYTAHSVRLVHDRLRSLYQAEEIWVNSFHHQAVRELGDGLEAAAVAPDGIVEALVHRTYTNLLAVQWHPEMMIGKDELGLVPFRWLAEAARKARDSEARIS